LKPYPQRRKKRREGATVVWLCGKEGGEVFTDPLITRKKKREKKKRRTMYWRLTPYWKILYPFVEKGGGGEVKTTNFMSPF